MDSFFSFNVVSDELGKGHMFFSHFFFRWGVRGVNKQFINDGLRSALVERTLKKFCACTFYTELIENPINYRNVSTRV